MYPSSSPDAPLPRRKLFCLGDSLTFGFGVAPSERWLNLAAEGTAWRLMNRGLCGDTTGGMLVRLRELLVPPKPEAVLLMGGSNDVFYSGSDQGARANMGAMIHQLLSAGVLPLVGIPTSLVPGWHPEEWGAVVDFEMAARTLEDYCTWLLAYCRVFGVETVDFRRALAGEDGRPQRELYLDGLHPNREGHRRMAALLSARLRELEGRLSE